MGNPARARMAVLAVLILAAIATGARPVDAQVTSALAQLNGTVRDENGGVVARAVVSLKDTATNHVYSATSNDAGYYVLLNVQPGQYELSADYTGFGKYTRNGLVLSVGQAATVDIVLRVAAHSETVVVTTEAPPVEPTRTEISQVVNTHQIESLPISGRQFIDFALLTPGVATGRTSLQSTFTDPETVRISFGGQRDLNNGVTVDGADNLNEATGSQRATPSQEAVSEFRVVNNSFGAEYGRALGGIVNIVTKSGSNDYHGSVYDYLRNNATDARSILTLPGFNALRQNQFGFTFGGPVVKDKTFFFMNYEGQRRAQSPTYPGVLVDNIGAINAVKQSFGIAPENLSVLKINNYDNGFFRVDHQINQKNQLMVRYFIEDSRNQNMLVGETLDGGGI
ncbi:MAG: carboxypeptidase regulatory-like domain-containing protein, partial [Blastocatellia bacterium]